MGDADHAFEAGALPAAMLRAFVDQVRDLVALTDAIGTIIWGNVGFAQATGFIAGSLGQSLLAYSPAGPAGTSSRLALAEMLAAPASEGKDIELRKADGSAMWADARVQQLEGRLLWTFHDVTAAHQLSTTAQRQKELLETALDFGRIGIWERAIPSGEGYWDEHIFDFWGLDPKAGVPSHEAASQRLHPEDRATSIYPESTKRAGRYSRRYRIVRADGSTRWIHSQWVVKNGRHGVPDRAIGIMMDDTEPYEAARALDGATRQLQMAVELGKITVWRHDLRTNLLTCNDDSYERLGMPHRPEGQPLDVVRSYIHPDDVPQVAASAAAALATDLPNDVETRYRRPDGGWVYVLTRRVVERDPAGQPMAFVGLALDMTERVEHLRRAEELSRRLEAASLASGIGIWTTTLEPVHTDWNAQMFVLFDRHDSPAAPAFGDWLRESVHEDDRGRIGSLARAYLHRGDTPFEIEFRALRRDGGTRWIVLRADVDLSGAARRVVGVAMDVTERHEVLDALREASRRAAFITRQAGIGMWEANLEGDNEQWDDRMFELRGMAPASRVPEREERLAMVHPDDLHHVLDTRNAQLNAALPMAYEFRVRLADGSYRWLASRSAIVVDSAGRPMRRVGANWDVTEGKNADMARQQAELAEREIAAKSQFLSRMSHELRTPLNAVLGFTQLLQLEARQSNAEGQLAKLGHIRAAGDHLLSLINDVLDLSGLESGDLPLHPRPVAVGDLVRQALPLVQSLAEQHGVSIAVGRADGAAQADPTRLRQVVINLLSNAIKYNRRGGRVLIESVADVDAVRLFVRDTGRGLTGEQIASLFEPFNRFGVEQEGIEGTGIGLTIVKALVDGMGGAISVSSEPGEGTVFEIALPAATTVPAASAAEAPESAPSSFESTVPADASTHEGSVLYIEDNPVNVLLVEELVASLGGIAIVSEANGEAGVARAQRLLPDLVLVDMQLPDFDGYEVLRRLRADVRTREIRCIALSANAMPEDIERGLEAGFADYWTKPIDFPQFIASMNRLFGGAAARSRAGAQPAAAALSPTRARTGRAV